MSAKKIAETELEELQKEVDRLKYERGTVTGSDPSGSMPWCSLDFCSNGGGFCNICHQTRTSTKQCAYAYIKYLESLVDRIDDLN